MKKVNRPINLLAPPDRPTGGSIKLFRQEMRLSQGALATLLGSSPRAVQEWEGDRTAPPPMLQLAMAAIRQKLMIADAWSWGPTAATSSDATTHFHCGDLVEVYAHTSDGLNLIATFRREGA